VRTIDLDVGLVEILRRQREAQRFEARSSGCEVSEYVFAKPTGGGYHPQHLSRLLAELAVEAGLPRLTDHGAAPHERDSTAPGPSPAAVRDL